MLTLQYYQWTNELTQLWVSKNPQIVPVPHAHDTTNTHTLKHANMKHANTSTVQICSEINT